MFVQDPTTPAVPLRDTLLECLLSHHFLSRRDRLKAPLLICVLNGERLSADPGGRPPRSLFPRRPGRHANSRRPVAFFSLLSDSKWRSRAFAYLKDFSISF